MISTPHAGIDRSSKFGTLADEDRVERTAAVPGRVTVVLVNEVLGF